MAFLRDFQSRDQSLNLNALAIGLGLEVTEYEPEQFPGLVYRPAEAANVVLLFTSGRVVITGSPNLDAAEDLEIEYVDGEELVEMLNESSLNPEEWTPPREDA